MTLQKLTAIGSNVEYKEKRVTAKILERVRGAFRSRPQQINTPSQRRSLLLFATTVAVSGALSAAPTSNSQNTQLPVQIAGSGTAIDCNGSPFGRRLPIGLDQEVVVTAASSAGTSQSFQLSGNLDLERSNPIDGVLANATQLATAPADLNGDGIGELVVVAAQSDATIGVRIVRQDSSSPLDNVQVGAYEWTLVSPATEILDLAVAAADLDGSTDGREEVVIAIRYDQDILRVIALSGDSDGNIQQSSDTALATWTLPAGVSFGEESYMRMDTGDVLLEGSDQVILYYDSEFSVLRATGSAVGSNPSMTFTHQIFGQAEPPNDPTDVRLHVANLGGSAAAEVLIHEQTIAFNGATPQNIRQIVRFFTTERDDDDEITSFDINPDPQTASNTIGGSGFEFYDVAVGEMDRRPGNEFVVARQLDGTNVLSVEMYRVSFDGAGLVSAVGAVNPAVVATTSDLRRSFIPVQVVVGDAEGDAIGDVYVTASDRLANNEFVPRVFKFSMTRPTNPNEFPDVTTFAQVGSVDLPEAFGDQQALRINQIQLADWDNDSVLGDLGSNCQRVDEPLIRTVVKLPPYWERLQTTRPGDSRFNASVGQTQSAGSTLAQRYDTFTSDDISGYVGLSAGGSIFGIGIETTVKATAGKNSQSTRGEIFSTELETTTSQTQSQTTGEGLLVLENNTFDCYSYDVVQNGAAAAESLLRVCEWIEFAVNGDSLRSFRASDLESWDTVTGAGTGAGTPAQWTPLQPDWASISLFRSTSTNITPAAATTPEHVVDGLFDTALESEVAVQPYVEIDLGEVRDITSIRVFPEAGQAASLVGFQFFASRSAFASDELPSGPGVRAFLPDPVSSNGVDRWNIRTREGNAGFEPMRARYLRLQHPGTARLQIAQIQVFGAVHQEPPSYPQSVCDPVADDGFFLARIADTVTSTPSYRNIQIRGDLSWTGAITDAECGQNFDGLPDGVNDGFARIWDNIIVGGSGDDAWDLENTSESAYGEFNAISHSTRVGAEIEIEVGPVVAGAAYSFETGVSRENSSTIFWGQGLQYSGAVAGFEESSPGCEYRPQPYSYVTSERSNVGYTHRFTVVDYVVRDLIWSRLGSNQPPANCFIVPEDLFADGFEALLGN